MELHKGSRPHKCLPVYRQTQMKTTEHHTDIKDMLILTCYFRPINFGHKIYWTGLFLLNQNNNAHIFLLGQLIYEGSEVLLSKVKIYIFLEAIKLSVLSHYLLLIFHILSLYSV